MSVRWLSVRGGATSARLALMVVGALSALLVVLAAVLPEAALADSCPNASLRFGASANLPDCRAYELVTPRAKEDNSSLIEIHGFADGEHVLFSSLLPLPGSQNGQEQKALSSRTPEGWITTPLTPPDESGEPNGLGGRATDGTLDEGLSIVTSFAGDFSAAFVSSPLRYGALDQNKQWNVFRVDVPSGVSSIESLPEGGPMTEELIDPPNIDSTFSAFEEHHIPGSFLAGSSADGNHLYFETTVKLPVAAGSPEDTHTIGKELYERHGGHTYAVGVLPDGSVPACGSTLGTLGVQFNSSENGVTFSNYGAASGDGANVLFHTPGDESGCESVPFKSYLREDNGRPDARTVELPGVFAARTADESKLLLYSLANRSLYEYDIPSGQTTAVSEPSTELVAFAADGSRVYSTPGSNSGGHLSLYEDGAIKPLPIPAAGLVGHLLPRTLTENTPAVSPDGSRLVFVDSENLTGYDSKGHHEVYVYDANSAKIACVSCNPDGSAPHSNSGLLEAGGQQGEGGLFEGKFKLAVGLYQFTAEMYPAISNDEAHVFFDSQEGLVAQDTNGLEDVYEWVRVGTGTCGSSNPSYSSVSGGCVYLISSGTGSSGSWIVGASEDASNVFFVSHDSLLPQVDETSNQVYDARVDGGFPYTPPGHGCDSGQCQGPQTPAPLLLAPPPSATFVGVGNPTPETSLKAKPKSKKPVKHKKRSKKKHKGKSNKAGKRTGKGRK